MSTNGKRREMKRGTMLTLVALGIGIVCAVAAGALIYYLNKAGRMG